MAALAAIGGRIGHGLAAICGPIAIAISCVAVEAARARRTGGHRVACRRARAQTTAAMIDVVDEV